MKRSIRGQFAYPVGLLLATFVVLLVSTAAVGQASNPTNWARHARLESVVVGGADTRWAQLTSRISENEREGQDLNQLLDIIEKRPDNTGGLMPIPYRQWAKEQSDPWWAKLLHG